MGHGLSPEQKITLLGCQVAEIDQQTFGGKKEPFFTPSSYFRDLEIMQMSDFLSILRFQSSPDFILMKNGDK